MLVNCVFFRELGRGAGERRGASKYRTKRGLGWKSKIGEAMERWKVSNGEEGARDVLRMCPDSKDRYRNEEKYLICVQMPWCAGIFLR